MQGRTRTCLYNHGLPLFWGKVVNVFDNSQNDGDADEEDDESDKAPEYLVEIHEYIQTENNAGEPTGKCQLHNIVGERKIIRKPQQPRRSLRKSQ